VRSCHSRHSLRLLPRLAPLPLQSAGATAVYLCCQGNHTECLELLVNDRADLNIKTVL
jgi:hypothetical protein